MGRKLKVHDLDLTDFHWSKARDKSVSERTQAAKRVKPMTANHAKYLTAIDSKKCVVCTGPAGTGKTYMACGKAVEMLKSGAVSRIILTRPQEECGEKMGFMPGGNDDKLIDMMVPLLDNLDEFLAPGELDKLREEGKVVMVALGKMRGRTIKDAFVILDEAQNATHKQLKMFVTRFGNKCKMVVCGDPSQSDLPYEGVNSLADACRRFRADPHPSVAVVHMGAEEDIVRDELVRWFDRVLSTPVQDAPREQESPAVMVPCPQCDRDVWYDDAADDGDRLIQCPHCESHIELRDEAGRYDPTVVEPDEDELVFRGYMGHRLAVPA